MSQSVITRSLGAVLVLTMAMAAGPAWATDGDSDKIEDDEDNCLGAANPFQFDVDADGEGDLCERPMPVSDDFSGTPGRDLVFGSFRSSRLSGGPASDSLYGEGGDDTLDGGAGTDALAGGPGDDRLTGGPHCDVFGIELGIEQRDSIADFDPLVDRVRFTPLTRVDAVPPDPVVADSDWLELGFQVAEGPTATVVFEGIRSDARVVISTEPCGVAPPPASICPARGAYRTLIHVGQDDMFCPGDGALHLNVGAYTATRLGSDTPKQVPAKEGRRG